LKPESKPAILGGSLAFETKLPIVRPSLPPLDPLLEEARAILASGQLTNGRYVRELEQRAAAWLGVPHCVAMSSCTSGLALVLRALDLAGEVILPSFTFFATAHAIVWNGLRPVFADCEADSFNIDPGQVRELVTPATSAILAVHMYGNPANTEALEKLACERGLKLIFDAAHAFGSRRAGRPVGGFGDAEVFSLSPTKLLVAGEGGLVATRDAELAERLRAARNYGDSGTYDPVVLGLNARMTEINALLALHGLPGVEAQVARRNAIARLFMEGLSTLPGVSFQKVRPQDVSTYKDFSTVVNAEQFGLDRDQLAAALTAENIEVRKYFYPPVHEQALYRSYFRPDKDRLHITEGISHNVLSFPIYASLSDEAAHRLIEAVRRVHAYRSDVKGAVFEGAKTAGASRS